MQQFKIESSGINELQKVTLPRVFFMMAIVILVVLLLPSLMSDGNAEISSSTWLTVLILLPVLLFTYFFTLKKLKATLASYTLVVDDDRITREMMNTPTISILKKDIQQISKEANGAMTVLGHSRLNAIGISAHIERKEELEQLLAEIKPITVKTSAFWLQTMLFSMVFIVIALFLATFYIDNRYISCVSGTALIAILGYSFIAIQKSKNVDKRTKRLSYVGLIPLLSIAYSVWAKWMNLF